jgi:cell division protein FtsB
MPANAAAPGAATPPAAPPAAAPNRCFRDHDLTFITTEDWAILTRYASQEFAGPEVLVLLWRLESPVNQGLVMLTNVNDHSNLSCWHGEGGYLRINARYAVHAALLKPLQALSDRMEQLHPFLQELCMGAGHVCSQGGTTALGKMVGYVEAKARTERGCTMEGLGVPARVQDVALCYLPAGNDWWDLAICRSMWHHMKLGAWPRSH